ncbi:non-specific serine/threonine protein kinase [Chitinophaga skermanii]|uniref:Non-specific serine/threonine protein kinase n=1 Tax=Chitinophaga skermanii TaxID=331697 RepID=A0A327QB56_9BACT|nr:DEAD/DEAH box helicase [Chitinophaga skermanii]RAJ01521.1 non-specific serine/threonine protein kinase [Chitinophaga skermanii]
MSLPHLLKYIYNNGTDEVIRRGKRIYASGGVELIEADPVLKSASFRVKSDTHANYYRVSISKYHETSAMSVRCQCPYNLGDICRHEAAALFQLQEMLDKNHFESFDSQFDQQHTVIKMKSIDLKTIKLLTSPSIFAEAEKILRKHQAKILSAKDEKVEALLKTPDGSYQLILQRNEERNFDTHCVCDEHDHALCVHKTALFLQLLNQHGAFYFDTLRNWDKEKNKLLSLYGYSLSDDLDGKFTFTYTNGKPFLRVLDPSIKKVETVMPVSKEVEPATETQVTTRRIGVVLNANESLYPYFAVDLITGEANEDETEFLSLINKLDLTKYIDYYQYREQDRELIAPTRKLQQSEISKFLNKNSPFAGIWDNITHETEDALPSETKELILEYLHPKLIKFFDLLSEHKLVYLLRERQVFKTKTLEPIIVSGEQLQLNLQTEVKNNTVHITAWANIEGELVNIANNKWNSPLVFLHGNIAYLFKQPFDAMQAELYQQSGEVKVPLDEWGNYLSEKLLPLGKDYQIQYDKALLAEVKTEKPECRVHLKEIGETFVIQPTFSYRGHDVEWNNETQITIQEANKVLIIHRNKELEDDFVQKIRSLHSNFAAPTHYNYFYLRSKEALTNNWFFLFFDTLKEMNVRVFGFDGLRNFRFNPAKPVTSLQISSGIDWFDAQVEVAYGDQKVSIKDIKKALANKQNYVQLADGTLGLLPEEWLKKYSLLFKIGEEKDKGLKLSKYNFNVIDELYEFIDDDQVLRELDEKRRKLIQFDEIRHQPLPDNMHANLRPYQESGFQWLNYLDEVKWGGILADDMGLGKTIQALTFIQHYKNKNGRCLTMVVCPTTLIYNWENEIKKFTPTMTHHIHHGPTRIKTPEAFQAFDIIITTYGTLRSDIQMFMKLEFDYVVLDESQAIKNPQSKVTKAAQLLHTRNRLALSGTPMQNNTFDIYAQMNFLNPGMLGSVDFFRNEFATPIDKFQDEERKDHLRKLIYPFILRRTKEQVAKDLPDKIETVIFCEMDSEQRQIYDAYRNSYRSKILGVIEDQGIERSQLTILQGLMKLRQICDSPAILNETEQYPNHSVKLHELTRELSENIGNHKVLIFSQFLGMLGLIKEKLSGLKVPFEYFDGSTSTMERERAIQNFQNNSECRVFLISLKAGGVGLNLTAADYVYIVDPWWNPAVEQQAIDRTHRIGQTKNIFAYRMICKDTVEEKILELQERKKSLVKEIVADETGFVKKLTKEDVMYLFS